MVEQFRGSNVVCARYAVAGEMGQGKDMMSLLEVV
jgi:hypothetical protein